MNIYQYHDAMDSMYEARTARKISKANLLQARAEMSALYHAQPDNARLRCADDFPRIVTAEEIDGN